MKRTNALTIGILAAGILSAGTLRAEEKPHPDREKLREMSVKEVKEKAQEQVEKKVDRMLTAAKGKFLKGKYVETRELCEEILRYDPDNREAERLFDLAVDFDKETFRQPDWRDPGLVDQQWKKAQKLAEEGTPPPVRDLFRKDPRHMKRDAEKADAEKKREIPEWKKELQEKLSEKQVKVDFQDSSFEDVRRYLEGVAGVPIVVDRKYKEGAAQTRISFRGEMPLEVVLKWIVENELGLAYMLKDHAVWVSDRKSVMAQNSEARVYDVTELLYVLNPTDFPGPEMDLTLQYEGAEVFGVPFDSRLDTKYRKPVTTEEDLIRMIKGNVEPGTWEE